MTLQSSIGALQQQHPCGHTAGSWEPPTLQQQLQMRAKTVQKARVLVSRALPVLLLLPQWTLCGGLLLLLSGLVWLPLLLLLTWLDLGLAMCLRSSNLCCCLLLQQAAAAFQT
jgi:hypothetical protein